LFSPAFVEKAEIWQVESGAVRTMGRAGTQMDADSKP